MHNIALQFLDYCNTVVAAREVFASAAKAG